MARKKVEFIAGRDEIKIGNPNSPHGKCALLVRGRTGRITTFVLTPGQERSLKAGKKINITMQAIERAETPCGYRVSYPGAGGRPEVSWTFETGSGLGRTARRRKRTR